jgi:hypothetical protein
MSAYDLEAAKRIRELEAEVERLRTENANYERHAQERANEHAQEVKRLRAARDGWHIASDEQFERADKAEAEVERLRAACKAALRYRDGLAESAILEIEAALEPKP